MKKALYFFISVLLILPVMGCQSSPNRAPEGALIGGLIGAGAGAIIGNQGKDRDQGRTEGALIGGAVGALTGALAGSQMQKQPAAAKQTPAQTQAMNPSQMSIQQIVDLSSQGINEDVIVDKIHLSNSRFNLSADDINYLKQNGVSQKVINAMQGW
jgi:uncharacterized protein YcfJ